MTLPTGLHIVQGVRGQSKHSRSQDREAMPNFADWLDYPESWDRQKFLNDTSHYLNAKNCGIGIGDSHLLRMLASQIEIYIQSVVKLKNEGLVTGFNGGITSGPNPYITIADKSLNRCLQLMKELELSPKSRDGYQPKLQRTPELQSLLDGP